MARTREFDEHKALDSAMQLFWEKGFEAASLSDLTAKMGIQRPSLYAAFGDKKQLFEAALRQYTRQHAADARAILKQQSVKQSFRDYFEGVVERENGDAPSRGCFCINTMVELAPHDPKFEILTREHQLYLSALFQETIERGISTGELKPGTSSVALAQALVVSLIGLTVMLKAKPDRLFIDNTVNVTLSLLD
jgi:TetR/AcrR family transcriptional repressor of nem operon